MRTKWWARRSRWAAVAFVSVATAAGLLALPGGAGAAPAQTADQAAWTVLIYGDLDNNLEEDTLRNMFGPAGALPASEDVNVVAVIDRIEGFDDGPLASIPNFGDAKLIEFTGNATYREVQALGEIDMGDPQTLAWFVNSGVQQFPAEKYALFFSDHGGGYLGVTWDDSTPTSERFGAHLTVDEMGEGIKAGLAGTGVDEFELIGFDTCLTATVEIASTLAPVGKYMVASEEIATGLTTNYAALVRLLQAQPGADGEEAGRTMVHQPGVVETASGTFSLIDLSRMEALDQAVASLADALTANLAEVATEVGRQRSMSLEFGLEAAGGAGGYGAVDFGDLLARLEAVPPAVDTARQAAFNALQNAVLDQQAGPAATQATGLTIYFPGTTQEYDPTTYNEIDVARPWSQFLAAYFELAGGGTGTGGDTGGGTGGATDGGPEFASATATIDVDATGVLVTADLVPGTETGVVDASFLGGVLLPDSAVAHLFIAPAVIGAGGPFTIAAGWDFGYLQLTDGEVFLDTTTLLTPVVDGLLGQVPLLYQDPLGNQLDAAIQFTLDAQGNLVGDPLLMSYAETGAAARLVPEPGSLLAPLVVITPVGGESVLDLLSDQGVDGPSAGLSFTLLAPGSTFHVGLSASDAAGRTTAATATGTVV